MHVKLKILSDARVVNPLTKKVCFYCRFFIKPQKVNIGRVINCSLLKLLFFGNNCNKVMNTI